MNELLNFNYQDKAVRVDLLNDQPWWCLKDVCEILGIDQPTRVAERLDQKGVSTNHTLTNGGIQNMLFINEANLYRVIFQSRKAEAVLFQNWVFEVVLPSIRANGSFGRADSALVPSFDWKTIAEASAILGVSAPTVLISIREGAIPAEYVHKSRYNYFIHNRYFEIEKQRKEAMLLDLNLLIARVKAEQASIDFRRNKRRK